jgi:hypothetical protein
MYWSIRRHKRIHFKKVARLLLHSLTGVNGLIKSEDIMFQCRSYSLREQNQNKESLPQVFVFFPEEESRGPRFLLSRSSCALFAVARREKTHSPTHTPHTPHTHPTHTQSLCVHSEDRYGSMPRLGPACRENTFTCMTYVSSEQEALTRNAWRIHYIHKGTLGTL